MVDVADLGPLGWLVGTWEGGTGLDVAFSHERGEVWDSPYREVTTFSAFGPVDNGDQALFGLDYRSAMWRDEGDPFHTEIGYWLWDAATNQVMKSFMIPRGVTLIAGGTSSADATSFTMRSELGHEQYGIVQNSYLLRAAKTLSYEVTITQGDDGSMTYEQTTMLAMKEFPEPFAHTDRNTLTKTA